LVLVGQPEADPRKKKFILKPQGKQGREYVRLPVAEILLSNRGCFVNL
jgi:hypothetical protein